MPSTQSAVIPQRSSGLLLHPTCLPGRFAIGDLGPSATAFLQILQQAGQRYWQVLPLGPTGYGDSPYQSFSAFAGNPLLISPERLLEDRLIDDTHLTQLTPWQPKVPFAEVIREKKQLHRLAWQNFHAGNSALSANAWQEFLDTTTDWLPDYTLFMALKQRYDGQSWHHWPDDVRFRDSAVLQAAAAELQVSRQEIAFEQFLFHRQWAQLRASADDAGVSFIGDMPIFIAEDSADVWCHPELFVLDAARKPSVVAGVPPDYFSQTGQRWGNPHYRWSSHREQQYSWWRQRVRSELQKVDVIRLDHFRGFAAAWAIPADEATAEGGTWVAGPGAELLHALHDSLGSLPLIAEDLGVITPDVDTLREQFALPGMRILQFAFGGAVEERFLPHLYKNPIVCYTGTHDNDTTRGWYENALPDERAYFHRYIGNHAQNIAWQMIRLAWSSIAELAICPIQDLLNRDSSARMNTPGVPQQNWHWRMDTFPDNETIHQLRELTELFHRLVIPHPLPESSPPTA